MGNPRRWRMQDEVVEHKATFFVPGGPKGPGTVTERKGYVLRERGDTAELRERLDVTARCIKREFYCEVHGRFAREVDELTDEVACNADSWASSATGETEYATRETCEDAVRALGVDLSEVHFDVCVCGLTSPWSPSTVGVGKSSGEMAC